jgi:PhnB protein
MTSTHLHPYLAFNGNCREAMTFYRDCLGGKLFMQTVGESLMVDKWPIAMHHRILHGSLTRGNVILLASDMGNSSDHSSGGLISLALACRNEREIKRFFSKLSRGGRITHPLHHFENGTIGALTDKFGMNWILRN